jgi:copper(I)-binding protein
MHDPFRAARAAVAALAALPLAFASLPALAHDGLAVRDAYVRASGPMAMSAAAFMVIENHRAIDDRLISARSEAARRVELHTHRQDAQGVMRMVEVPEGFVIPAGGEHALERGGDHVMLMGLTSPLTEGATVRITLVFEVSGELEVEVPVADGPPGGPAGHAGHGHSGH